MVGKVSVFKSGDDYKVWTECLQGITSNVTPTDPNCSSRARLVARMDGFDHLGTIPLVISFAFVSKVTPSSTKTRNGFASVRRQRGISGLSRHNSVAVDVSIAIVSDSV